jgi:galactonate dehydratase
MKITKISTAIMAVSRPRPGIPSIRRNWIFVKVETDSGLFGLGEATTEWHEHAVVAMINEHFAPKLIGKDPTRITRAWQELRRLFWWRDGVVASSAASGIEQALWDISGKACGLPVYKLLGGEVRDRVRLYARNDLGLDDEVRELEAALSEGFTGFKTGPSPYHDPYHEERQVDDAIALAERLRKAAGPDVDLMMDCLGNFSLHAAHRLIEGFKHTRPLFVEEPVNADTPASLLTLRQVFPGVRIAAGERLMTRWGVREWLEKGAVDVLQPDVCHCGGIGELMRIAAYAEVYNVAIAPHNPYGPVAFAANVHACAAMQNFMTLEHWRDNNLFDKAQKYGPRVENGCALLDDRPGLGVDLDWDFIAQHPYQPVYNFHFNDRDGGLMSI